MGEDMLTVAQAAERMGVTPETVRRQIREGQLRGSRASGGARAAWRIPRGEIERRLSVPTESIVQPDRLAEILEELRGLRLAVEALNAPATYSAYREAATNG